MKFDGFVKLPAMRLKSWLPRKERFTEIQWFL